ncbi:MAG: ATP-binding protein, partial [Kordiimonas sp.]
PSHILRPIVENAFKHGMQAGGHLDITITSRKENGHLEITVRNSLNNMPDTSRKGEGLTLTELRLQKHYDSKAVFERKAKPDHYEAKLKLPAKGNK